MTDTEIRIAAAKYLDEDKTPTAPADIAKAIGITKEALIYALDKLHPYKNPDEKQDELNFINVWIDGASGLPVSYSKNGNTKKFLNAPF